MNTAGNILDMTMTLPHSSDRDLMERFRQGDSDAFTVLYRTHSPDIFRFAFHMTGNRIKAAEITQDVFVWLIHHPSRFDAERGGRFSCLAGVACPFVRREQRMERRWLSFEHVAWNQPSEAHDPGRAIDAEALRKAVAVLPMRYREPVVLCDLEGHSYEQAARLLDCPVGTIRSRLHRAHELLARKFQRRKTL